MELVGELACLPGWAVSCVVVSIPIGFERILGLAYRWFPKHVDGVEIVDVLRLLDNRRRVFAALPFLQRLQLLGLFGLFQAPEVLFLLGGSLNEGASLA